MDPFDKQTKKELHTFLKNNIQFTDNEKRRILKTINQQKKRSFPNSPVYWSVLTAAIGLFLFLSFSFITSYVTNPASTGQNAEGAAQPPTTYSGKPLRIGIIGEKPIYAFDQISFHEVEPDSLKQNSADYDAFFITDRYFEALSTDEWTETFTNIRTPVFFIGLDVQAFIYHTDNSDYGSGTHKANSHTQGFVGEGTGGTTWGYGDPTGSTDPEETPEKLFSLIFHDIEAYQSSK